MFFTSPKKYIVKETMKQMKVSKEEAEKRIDALLKSGILAEGSFDDEWTQLRIENFLRFDLSKLEYEDVFRSTLNFPALVLQYDKMKGTNLTTTLDRIRKDIEEDFIEAKRQIELFDDFFCKYIWNYFPNVQKFDADRPRIIKTN